MNIYVGNLSAKTTEEELRGAFESFGDVDTAKIIKDNITGRSRASALSRCRTRIRRRPQ